jgi:hypothetical protein
VLVPSTSSSSSLSSADAEESRTTGRPDENEDKHEHGTIGRIRNRSHKEAVRLKSKDDSCQGRIG